MHAAKDMESYLAHPVGRFVCGPRFIGFCDSELTGMVVWENPTPADAESVLRTLPVNLGMRPHAVFIDARRMTQNVDPLSFSTVVEQAGPTLPRYRGHVDRCAVVLPPGMAAAVVMGFFTLIEPPFEVRFFADPFAALEYAGEREPQRFLAELDAIQERASGSTPLLFRLRAILDHDPAEATVESVARELSLSTRSLQRRLVEAGTSFRSELLSARLRKAQRLLTATDLKVISVALEVGCASSQHLSSLFRKMTGESPSAWRATHRLVA